MSADALFEAVHLAHVNCIIIGWVPEHSLVNSFIIGWVPGHSGIDGNGMADKLADQSLNWTFQKAHIADFYFLS